MDTGNRVITLPADIVEKVRESLSADDADTDSEVIVQALVAWSLPEIVADRVARLDRLRQSFAEAIADPVRISDNQLGSILASTVREAAHRRR